MSALLFRDPSVVPTAMHRFFKRLCLLPLSLLFTLITTDAKAMPIGEKLYLMSEISGTITLNGEPAAGAKLKRTVSRAHSQSQVMDETITDDKGFFRMPAVTERKLIHKIFPMEFVVPSEIYVTYKGQEYFIWTSTKREPEKNTENKGKPLVVHCELTGEEKGFMIDGSFFTTLCVWDVEIDPPYEFGPPGSGN